MRNLIRWIEIPATDIERAVSFYNQLLSLNIKVQDFGEEKMAFFPEDEINVGGAISVAKDFNPSSDGSCVTFAADGGLQTKIDHAVALGATVLTSATEICCEGKGYFALIRDPEGNRIGLHALTL